MLSKTFRSATPVSPLISWINLGSFSLCKMGYDNPHLVKLLFLFALLQRYWPSCLFLKYLTSFLPQGQCISCLLCLECSLPHNHMCSLSVTIRNTHGQEAKKERKDQGSLNLSKAMSPYGLKTCSVPHLQKLPPPPRYARLGTRPVTHRPWGTTTDPNCSSP